MTAQATRAVLLASATMTNIAGFLVSIPESHAFGVTPLRLAHLTPTSPATQQRSPASIKPK